MINTSGAELFIEDLKHQCKRHGVKLIFNRSRTVLIEGKIRSSGYFDPANKELKIGKNRPDWLQLLVHESCHVDQWIENAKCWQNEGKIGNDIIDAYLLGKDFNHNKLKKAFKNTILLELDCERRAIDKIVEYDLPINISSYIQRANAYLFYHHRAMKLRTWDPMFYNKIGLISNMPTKILDIDRYISLPKTMEKYFF